MIKLYLYLSSNTQVLCVVKHKVKSVVNASTLESNTRHLYTLFKQGEFLKFAQEEKKGPNMEIFHIEP